MGGKEVIMLEKFAAIGGNIIRTGGQVNAVEPDWQGSFPTLAGEKETLTQILNHNESDIDDAYLEDFRTLKSQIQAYLEDVTDKGNTSLLSNSLTKRCPSLFTKTKFDGVTIEPVNKAPVLGSEIGIICEKPIPTSSAPA